MSAATFIEGELVCGAPTTGLFATVTGVPDVLDLLDGDSEGLVLWLAESSVSLVTPVMELAVAVACPGGGAGAHIELVARELGIACVCAAREVGPLPPRLAPVSVDGQGRLSWENGA
jgi:hypothetical protein